MPARYRFMDRTALLLEMVGSGKLEMTVVVDQPYAKFQHERTDLRHPGGGGAKYLERALFGTVTRNMQTLRAAVLRGDLRDAMVTAGERVALQSFENAPFEFGDLKASHAIRVKDGGRMYMDRPPARKRLTKQELRAKSHLRSLGLGN